MPSETITPIFTQQGDNLVLKGFPPFSQKMYDFAFVTAVMCEAVEDAMLDTEAYKLDGSTSKEMIMGWAWEFVCTSPDDIEDWYELCNQFARLKYQLWAGLPLSANPKLLADCHPAFIPYIPTEVGATNHLKAGDIYCFESGRMIYVIDVERGHNNRLYIIDQEGNIDRQYVTDPDPSRIVNTHMTVGECSQSQEMLKVMFKDDLFKPHFVKAEKAVKNGPVLA